MTKTKLTLLDVQGVISRHLMTLINDGWAITHAEKINGDWYPRFELKKGNSIKTVLIKGYNPAPYKLLDNNVVITEFWPLSDGTFSENYSDWLADVKGV